MRMLDFILNGAFEVDRLSISAKNFEAGELGLVIGQRRDAADELEQADEMKVGVIRLRHCGRAHLPRC